MDSIAKEFKEMAKGFLYYSQAPGKEKISLGSDGGYHYTIHFGTNSKVLDLHRTDDSGNHKTLLRIPHYSLMRLTVHLGKVYMYAMKKYWYANQINIGKLNRYDCILYPLDQSEEGVNDFFNITRKGRKIRFKENMPLSKYANNFILPEKLTTAKDGAFMVYRFSYEKSALCYQGMLIKTQHHKNRKKYIFCSKKNYNAFMKFSNQQSFLALRKVNFEGKEEVLKIIWKRALEKYYSNSPKRRAVLRKSN
ncbi:MAG: hypothetical protein ABIQ40_20315 [Bacteroidia bacterium]